MQEARADIPAWREALHLESREAALLELVFVGHDLGRYVDFFFRRKDIPDNLSDLPSTFHQALSAPWKNHGVYTVDLAEEAGLLSKLADEDRAVVRDAWRWHGEINVDLPEGLARKLCYILRDNDKMDILAQGTTYTPEFALKEITGIFGLSKEEQQRLSDERARFLDIAQSTIWPGGASALLSEADATDPLAIKIHSLLTGTISADEEAVQAVLSERTADASKTKGTFASFLLMHIAMTFDLQFKRSFERINSEKLLEFEWGFIQERCDPLLFSNLKRTWENFVRRG